MSISGVRVCTTGVCASACLCVCMFERVLCGCVHVVVVVVVVVGGVGEKQSWSHAGV